MKNIKLIAVACLAILAAVACVKTEKNVEEPPGEEVVLSLCPSGEILEVADEPLSKAGLPDGTLYVISVYQGSAKYAHGVFDDPLQMSVRLSTGKAFSIQVKAIRSGVTEIASASGVYEGNGLLDNQFHYYASDKTDEVLYDNTADISALESQWLLDTYYGATTLTPTTQTSSVNIMLYHMMHKLTVKVNGFEPTDGSVSFTQNPYLPGTAAITLTPDAAEYSKLAVINTDFEEVISAISGNSDYTRIIAFTAEYTSTVGGEPYTKKLIDAAQVTFRRNRETTLTLNLSHNYLGNITATITLSVEGGDMGTDEITFDGEIDTDASGGTTTPTVPVPEAVDLGLSVKWASFNLGASKPEEYGDYYAWGETEPYYLPGHAYDNPCNDWKDGKTVGYEWAAYKFGTSNTIPFSKYNTLDSFGPVDNKTVLDPEDDAAYVNLGGSWRMPTYAECEELLNNCTWTWTDNYKGTGIAGRIVTSNKAGYTDKSIFLPAAGYRSSTVVESESYSPYWSSSLATVNPDRGWGVHFDSGYVYMGGCGRSAGQSIRPVYGNPAPVTTPINLSEGGTANCYIVNESGLYKFDASIIGNGASGIIAGGGFHTGSVSIAPVSADILWDDNSVLSSVSFSDGYVSFMATGNIGNALVAVRNASGEILWSWHIWSTKDIETIVCYNGEEMMDRNLGARKSSTSNPDDLRGLFYQWGRKDPMVKDQSAKVESSETTGTIDYSIRNPLTMITGFDTTAKSNYRRGSWLWGSSVNNYLWGNPDSKNSCVKTIYDPCPKGYKMSSLSTWNSVSRLSDDASGCLFRFNASGNTAYFTYGFIDHTGKWADYDNIYSSPAGRHITSCPYDLDNSLSGSVAFLSSAFYNVNNGDFRSYACNTRCVKE